MDPGQKNDEGAAQCGLQTTTREKRGNSYYKKPSIFFLVRGFMFFEDCLSINVVILVFLDVWSQGLEAV